MRPPYEFIEHTADYAIRARGRDFRELLENAARGLVSLLADVDGLAPDERVEIEAEGDSPEDVLVGVLREILYLEDDGRLPVTAECLEARPEAARMNVGTVALADAKDRLAAGIKAVTYHNLEVQRTEEGLVVEVVFDA